MTNERPISFSETVLRLPTRQRHRPVRRPAVPAMIAPVEYSLSPPGINGGESIHDPVVRQRLGMAVIYGEHLDGAE